MNTWYLWLSSIGAHVAGPANHLMAALNLSWLSALLLGLLGALAPCQLSTNAGALAFVVRRLDRGGAPWRAALGYVAGKALAYTLLGSLVLLLGRGAGTLSPTFFLWVRRLLGPAMVLLGLQALGWLRLSGMVGDVLSQRLVQALMERIPSLTRGRFGGETLGGLGLGLAFGLAFCPTLFWLFFGVTLPLAFGRPEGLLFPSLFALGTAAPMLVMAGLMATGAGLGQGRLLRARRAGLWLQRAAGLVFLLAGVNDILAYWLP